jgi:hypothetical protein
MHPYLNPSCVGAAVKAGTVTRFYPATMLLRAVDLPLVMLNCPRVATCRGKEKTVADVYFDKKEQLQKIEAALLPGETVEPVFDMKGGGTGFIGLTSKRVIIYDKTFMRKMKALVSIPYSKFTSIAAEDDSGLLTGRGVFASSKLALKAGTDEFEFDFRGADKAHFAHNLILGHIL